tara:strand:- start:297 stop:1229 length:933 start_codon:yes stop_codon:yes gene_type:complete
MSGIKSSPIVSIGLPIYNGEEHVREALDSLLSQTISDFELIISDNASIDKSEEICLEYARNDERICYYRSEVNNGAIWNVNRVFELSRGKYFMWAAHDDLWERNFIETCLKGFDSNADIILSATGSNIMNDEMNELIVLDRGLTTVGQEPAARFKKYRRMIQGYPNTNSIFYGLHRRETLGKVMPMKKIMAVDHVLLATSTLVGEFITSDEVLHYKRYGGASSSHQSNARTCKIDNPFLIKFPYLIREYYFQNIILTSGKISFPNSIIISLWSLSNYLFQLVDYHALLLTLKNYIYKKFQTIRSDFIQKA